MVKYIHIIGEGHFYYVEGSYGTVSVGFDLPKLSGVSVSVPIGKSGAGIGEEVGLPDTSRKVVKKYCYKLYVKKKVKARSHIVYRRKIVGTAKEREWKVYSKSVEKKVVAKSLTVKREGRF